MPYRFNPLPWKFDRVSDIASGGGVTQVTTDDSNTATPTAGNLNFFGSDTTADVTNGLQSISSGDTVTYQLTNRLTGTASVTGAVTGDIVTFDLGASAAVYRFEFECVGRDTSTGDGVGYSIFGTIRTDGASATVIDTAFKDADEDDSLESADLSFVASGNNVILRATGVAGQTISYNAVGKYVKV